MSISPFKLISFSFTMFDPVDLKAEWPNTLQRQTFSDQSEVRCLLSGCFIPLLFTTSPPTEIGKQFSFVACGVNLAISDRIPEDSTLSTSSSQHQLLLWLAREPILSDRD